jgi:AraC-like DNA-binding protein
MFTNLTGPLNLDQLAEKFYITNTPMPDLQEATGFGVMVYIIYCRILRARTLLCQGRSVQEAGEEAGFCNNAHFIRTFHKLTGNPPGRYARENRNYA